MALKCSVKCPYVDRTDCRCPHLQSTAKLGLYRLPPFRMQFTTRGQPCYDRLFGLASDSRCDVRGFSDLECLPRVFLVAAKLLEFGANLLGRGVLTLGVRLI